jgi:hypothetical protein
MGRPIKDLTGQIIGRFKVLYLDEERTKKEKKGAYWICECQCENKTIKSVHSGNLGRSIFSCGCYQLEVSKLQVEDLAHQTFGRLTVIERDLTKSKGTYWICQCNCDNHTIKSIAAGELKAGRTQSCGCLQKELISKRCKKYNTYDLDGKYGIGYTLENEEYYFDLEDYDKIKDYYWHIKEGYIINSDNLRMHRLVMNAQKYEKIDHISHKTYDNRKINLRYAKTKNAMNHEIYKNNTSGVAGVNWHNRDNIWEASIGFNNKQIYLGRFDNFDEAVKVRKKAEEKYHKDFSYDNSMKYAGEYIIK